MGYVDTDCEGATRPDAWRWVAGLAATVLALLAHFTGLGGSFWHLLDDPNGLGPRPAGATEGEVTLIPPTNVVRVNGVEIDVSTVPTEDLYVEGDCSSLFVKAMHAGWTWDTWPKLARIMQRESGCHSNPWGSNDHGHSYGLLQIYTRGRLWYAPIGWGERRSLQQLCGLSAKSDLLNPDVNLRCGRLLFEVRGWAPWR